MAVMALNDNDDDFHNDDTVNTLKDMMMIPIVSVHLGEV